MATLKDLREWRQQDRKLPGGGTLCARQPSLYCLECDSTSSADPGDYWNVGEAHVFECCGEPMTLVFERTVMVEVEKDRDFTALVEGLRAS